MKLTLFPRRSWYFLFVATFKMKLVFNVALFSSLFLSLMMRPGPQGEILKETRRHHESDRSRASLSPDRASKSKHPQVVFRMKTKSKRIICLPRKVSQTTRNRFLSVPSHPPGISNKRKFGDADSQGKGTQWPRVSSQQHA